MMNIRDRGPRDLTDEVEKIPMPPGMMPVAYWGPLSGPPEGAQASTWRRAMRSIRGKLELAASRVQSATEAAILALLGYRRVESAPAVKGQKILLPLSSPVNILPNTSAQITARPQALAFRPERIVIGGTPSDWVVNDVKVGNRSQFSQTGDVPGEMFAPGATDCTFEMETVQTAMDFVIIVTYVGKEREGAPFVATAIGTAATY